MRQFIFPLRQTEHRVHGISAIGWGRDCAHAPQGKQSDSLRGTGLIALHFQFKTTCVLLMKQRTSLQRRKHNERAISQESSTLFSFFLNNFSHKTIFDLHYTRRTKVFVEPNAYINGQRHKRQRRFGVRSKVSFLPPARGVWVILRHIHSFFARGACLVVWLMASKGDSCRQTDHPESNVHTVPAGNH